jgi:predicted nucleic acid-binding protein
VIVVDSSVWIFALRGELRPSTIKLREEVSKGNAVIGDIVLLEILRGARDDNHAAKLEANLRRLPLATMMDVDLALAAASNYRKLRSHGITAKSFADLIIATFCIEHSHRLLHDDRDFAPMVLHLGLRLAETERRHRSQ